MKYCRKCSIEYGDDTSFCSHCGNKLVDGNLILSCPNCKKEIGTTVEQFCPHCGKQLNSKINTLPNSSSKKYIVLVIVIITIIVGGYFIFKQDLINAGLIQPATAQEQYEYSQYLSQRNMKGESKDWLIQSAEGGHPTAQVKYAKHLISEGYLWEKSFDLLTKAAQNDNAEAQYLLGEIYYDGYLPAKARKFNTDKYVQLKNAQLAFMWYEKAAMQDHYEAQKTIGSFYELGLLVPQDYSKAFYWYQKLADKNDKYYKDVIAVWTIIGRGTKQNSAKGLNMLSELVEENYTNAMYSLAEVYLYGLGNIPKDPYKAIKLYEMAHDNGKIFAYTRIGYIYYNEPLVRNINKAIEYYKLSANAGDDMAINYLIEHYKSIGDYDKASLMRQRLSKQKL